MVTKPSNSKVFHHSNGKLSQFPNALALGALVRHTGQRRIAGIRADNDGLSACGAAALDGMRAMCASHGPQEYTMAPPADHPAPVSIIRASATEPKRTFFQTRRNPAMDMRDPRCHQGHHAISCQATAVQASKDCGAAHQGAILCSSLSSSSPCLRLP